MTVRAQRLAAWGRGHPLQVDALLAVALMLAVLPSTLGQFDAPFHIVIALAMTLPLAWRRRAPLVVFAAVALLALIQLLVAVPSMSDLAVLFALYAVAVYERRRWAFPAAIAVVELGAVLAVLEYTDTARVFAFVSLSAFVVAASALGFYVRTRRQHIVALEQRADQLERERDQQAQLAAAAERARIAREMHDVVAHNLSVMIALADGARLTSTEDPDGAKQAMDAVSSTGREALDEMRRLLGVLRDGENGETPFAPQPGIDALDGLLEQVRRAGLVVRLTRTGTPRPVGQGLQLAAYRLVQEALTNTLKHSRGASSAEVRMHYDDDALSLEVVDDGTLAGSRTADGHGLLGMRERVAAYGGAVESGPGPQRGWRVRARIPLVAESLGQ